ncbi:hypothetical protein RGUI_1138 [Rhodovulum sp. P5]|nr:hypothetical protein RGUI_1138 [Rhodovulum sp. P5]
MAAWSLSAVAARGENAAAAEASNAAGKRFMVILTTCIVVNLLFIFRSS